jgi:F-type H+-transporting ATPase subunit a
VVTTWGLMALMTLGAWAIMRRARIDAGPAQAALEIVVEALETQLREIMRRDPQPYLPMLGTMFLLLVFANLSAVAPGLEPPTGRIELPAALAIIVFFSVHVFGVLARGPGEYLRHYIRPSPIMLPLNIVSEITRIFSLMVRLFGNMMSHEFVLAIVVFLSGFLVPVPFMALGVLIGVIQAYIFTVLAAVFIGAAVGGTEA